MNATSAPGGFAPMSQMLPDTAQYIPNPAARSMSPQSQTPYSRNPPPAEARTDTVTGGHPVPVYTTQEVHRHSVPMGAAPLRQHIGSHNTRPAEQNVGDHPHFQHNRTQPAPLQIPPSPSHSANPQQLFNPPTHHHPNPLPSAQAHPSLRNHPDVPISPLDRTSATQAPRRQSDPSHPSPVHAERPQTVAHPAFDPLILSATETALAPVRSALDTVWTLAVNNMRLSMNKMNNDFTYLATQERQRNAHLASRLASLESHLQAARQDINVLRKERQELQSILQAYKDENRRLHSEKEHWEIERRVLTSMEGRRGDSVPPQFDMNKVLGAVTEQVSKEMEQKMSAFLDQIDEQKSLRNQAEQRFSETPQHLGHNRESSVQQSPYIPAQSPSLQRGSHSPTSTYVVSPISANAKSPTNASVTQQDGVSTPIDPRSMTPRTVLTSTPAETHTRDSPGDLHNSPSPTRNVLRRTSSCDDQQPRKRPRLNEREDGSSTPNPLSSAVVGPPEAIRSDHNPEPDTENVLSATQISEPKDGDVIRKDGEEEPASGSMTVKPEPLEDAEVTNIERSQEVTSSSPPARSTNLREYKPANIPNVLPSNQRNTKLGIGHIDLLYRTDNGMMTCRMCLSRSRDLLLSRDRSTKVAPVKKFEHDKATWDELISHCKSEHPKTCRDLEKLGPTQIAEMKQRLMSGEKPMVSRS